MSGQNESERADDDASTFPREYRGAHRLGVEENGAPLYYDAESNTVYTGTVDAGELTREWADERLLGDRSLSDYLDTESDGWRSLSEYAKRRLPGVDADGDDEGDR
jgi:hypothetical protein